jgi:peptidoglycan/LPS O-acetylase OafA/YrhL
VAAGASQQGAETRLRLAELDGLRAIAILMVLAEHYDFRGRLNDAFPGDDVPGVLEPVSLTLSLGWTGVDLFFVLSGFLLGGILMDNRRAPNLFRVFYARRAFRIWPLYYLVVGVLLLAPQPWEIGIDPAYGHAPDEEPLPAWAYLTLTQNVVMGAEASAGSIWLTPTWSLAVEEQFYLLLPVLIRFTAPRHMLHLIIGLIVVSILGRLAVLSVPGGDFAFWFLPVRAEALFWGVLAAWIVRDRRCMRLLHEHQRALHVALGVLAAATFVLAAIGYRSYASLPVVAFPPLLGYTVLSILFTVTLLVAITERRGIVTRVTRNRLLGKIGVISFGVYLLHLPVSGLFWHLTGAEATQGVTRALLTVTSWLLPFAVAALSWAFFERRIVEFGRTFRYRRAPQTAPEPVTAAA